MRLLAGTIAFGLALLRPSWEEGTPALPGEQPGALRSLSEQVQPKWVVFAEPLERESCSCLSAPLSLDLVGQAGLLLCGFLLGPALDLIWLLVLAWHRWTWGLVRVLQVRPSVRPCLSVQKCWLARRTLTRHGPSQEFH